MTNSKLNSIIQSITSYLEGQGFRSFEQEQEPTQSKQGKRDVDSQCMMRYALGFCARQEKESIVIHCVQTCSCFQYNLKYSSRAIPKQHQENHRAFLLRIDEALGRGDMPFALVEGTKYKLPYLTLPILYFKRDIERS